MVIKLTLYFKRGQRIELSPQQGAEAWPEPVSWHGYGAWQRKPSSGCCRVRRFWQAQAGRESWVFMTGVPGRTILLRQDLLTQCHPLPPTVHMAMPSLPLTSAWRVDSVTCYWIDRSAEGRMCCQRRLWRRVVIDPCGATFSWSWNYSSVTSVAWKSVAKALQSVYIFKSQMFRLFREMFFDSLTDPSSCHLFTSAYLYSLPQ